MGPPSAILAIDSLDRYISNTSSKSNIFECFWFANSSTITYVNRNTIRPVIGAIVTSNGPGWPAGVITIIAENPDPNFPTFTISALTTDFTPVGLYSVIQTYDSTSANQPTSNILISQYQGSLPFSNNFTIQSPGALIYGYINRIIVSQIQLQYNVPTVVKDKNDQLWISAPFSATFNATWPLTSLTLTFVSGYAVVGSFLPPPFDATTRILSIVGNVITIDNPSRTNAPTPTRVEARAEPINILIPHGFYFADELAATVEVLIAAKGGFWTDAAIDVSFIPRDGFKFQSTVGGLIYFPTPTEVLTYNPGESEARVLRTYKLFGMTIFNSDITPSLALSTQISYDFPIFIYTPYIDIYSDVLTNYQNVKDTNTSISKPKGLVARVYLSGTGQNQVTGSASALGTAPFVMTADLNSPKVIRWSPDVAVPSIDFQLLDQYGELLPGASEGHSTEFQMTLLCIEGKN